MLAVTSSSQRSELQAGNQVQLNKKVTMRHRISLTKMALVVA